MVAIRYFSDDADPPPFMKALAEARKIAVNEGFLYAHVQALICSIDQYCEAATGNREYLWNKPHTTPGGAPAREPIMRGKIRSGDVP